MVVEMRVAITGAVRASAASRATENTGAGFERSSVADAYRPFRFRSTDGVTLNLTFD